MSSLPDSFIIQQSYIGEVNMKKKSTQKQILILTNIYNDL